MSRIRFEPLPRWIRDVVPLIFWLALIFVLSDQPRLVEIEDHKVAEKFFFKLAHVIAYAVLAWLWWRVLAPRRQVNWSILLTAWVLSTLYGISDEIHQLYVPGRTGRVADVLFDTSGALLTVLLLRRFDRIRLWPKIRPFAFGVRPVQQNNYPHE